MRLSLILISSLIILIGCAPKAQQIHDEVYPIFRYASDMERWGVRDYRASKAERWVDGYLVGDCDEFAREVYERARGRGLDAEFVVVWRNEGNVLDGYVIKSHAVTIVDGYVADNMSRWVYPVEDLWKRWNRVEGI